MSHLRFRRCGLLLALSIFLAACTNPLASAPPTPTPTPQPTPTPTPIPLDETLTLEGGGLSLRYPGDWQTRVLSSTLTMAATQEAMDAPSPGEHLVVVVNSMPLDALAARHGAAQTDNIDGLFEISRAIPEQAGYTLSEPEPLEVDGKRALVADLEAGSGAGQLMVIEVPPRMVQVIGQAAPEAWEAQRSTFEEIAASISFFAPIATPTPTPESMAAQPTLVTEGPEGFVLRLGGNEGTPESRFFSVRGLATAPDGTLYVAESNQGVWVFAPDGTLQMTFGGDDLLDAYDVALAEDGDLFVADFGRNDIAHFEADGTLVNRWGSVGEQPDQFGSQSPERLALGPDGSIYAIDRRISEGNVSASVVRFQQDGTFVERIALPEGSDPNDLAIDAAGNIYLAETFRGAVTQVDPQGQLLARMGEDIDEQGIAASAIDIDDRGSIYVATLGKGIFKFAPGGALLGTIGNMAEQGTIPQPGEFSNPNGIAAAPGEIVWISDNDGEYSAVTALRLITDVALQATADTQATAEATPVPEDLLVSQWASEASASSFFSDDYAPDGMIGPPDVEGCLSSTDAWAAASPDTEETIALGFDTPVFASQINIHQNHQPGFVTRVDIVDEQGMATQVYSGTAALEETCPFVLEVNFGPTLTRVVSVTATIDQSQGATWNEVDAVELVGFE